MIWIQTFGGHKFDFDNIDGNIIKISDVAHHLSLLCRFTGACKYHYSVAQHSVLVAQLLPKELRIHGLLHDAPEAYLGDISRPLKKWGMEIEGLEEKVLKAIYNAYALDWPSLAALEQIKEADNIALTLEAKQLMLHSVESWSFMAKEVPNILIEQLTPEKAETIFLRKWCDFRG